MPEGLDVRHPGAELDRALLHPGGPRLAHEEVVHALGRGEAQAVHEGVGDPRGGRGHLLEAVGLHGHGARGLLPRRGHDDDLPERRERNTVGTASARGPPDLARRRDPRPWRRPPGTRPATPGARSGRPRRRGRPHRGPPSRGRPRHPRRGGSPPLEAIPSGKPDHRVMGPSRAAWRRLTRWKLGGRPPRGPQRSARRSQGISKVAGRATIRHLSRGGHGPAGRPQRRTRGPHGPRPLGPRRAARAPVDEGAAPPRRGGPRGDRARGVDRQRRVADRPDRLREVRDVAPLGDDGRRHPADDPEHGGDPLHALHGRARLHRLHAHPAPLDLLGLDVRRPLPPPVRVAGVGGRLGRGLLLLVRPPPGDAGRRRGRLRDGGGRVPRLRPPPRVQRPPHRADARDLQLGDGGRDPGRPRGARHALRGPARVALGGRRLRRLRPRRPRPSASCPRGSTGS